MMRRLLLVIIVVVLIGVAAWATSRALRRRAAPAATAQPSQAQAVPAATPSETAHITATLFYASADGQSLEAVKREVPLAEGLLAQGREILQIQLEPAPAPYLSTIPAGTMLRAFYVTDRGDAFVDLSGDISKAHPGGTLNELLTVDTIVDAVTANLPAVHRVQILVDGHEVDTIAGHVDIRHPLERDTTLVK
jgi:hypothetical protein